VPDDIRLSKLSEDVCQAQRASFAESDVRDRLLTRFCLTLANCVITKGSVPILSDA
jgi:hypothetical protein